MEGIKEFFFTFEDVEEAIEKLRGFLEREFQNPHFFNAFGIS